MSATTREVPRTIQVTQVQLDDEWYDLALIDLLVKTASTWSPSSFGSAQDKGLWFEEKTTILVDAAQIDSLVKRGWAKKNNSGGHSGTEALLRAVEVAGGLPAS